LNEAENVSLGFLHDRTTSNNFSMKNTKIDPLAGFLSNYLESLELMKTELIADSEKKIEFAVMEERQRWKEKINILEEVESERKKDREMFEQQCRTEREEMQRQKIDLTVFSETLAKREKILEQKTIALIEKQKSAMNEVEEILRQEKKRYEDLLNDVKSQHETLAKERSQFEGKSYWQGMNS